ncbi:DUF6809 family protein [Clostridium perfringens]|uniref:hypothetical protein n=1 Tax=Clostridium perfringens TaxID=1502 RepID=UPI0018E4338B|nr:hypothetical protein [Clostridium perfringens]ELC8451123.1 hypothetical protein [Clostridium perfringens]MBI6029314.1 hypothetical protein [Clostridium perfringens]MBI6034106.1 hypothetical protein [Clostridium perfringens]
MSFEKVQELLKDIILRELQVEYEYDFKYMLEEETKQKIGCNEKIENLYKILSEKLDDEGKRVLFEFTELQEKLKFQESDYYFERGVRVGLTDLSYLKKYFNDFLV